MRFAHKVEIFYTDTAELIADLERCLEDVEVGEEPSAATNPGRTFP